MRKKVKVILLEDIPSLGGAGQIISVAEGYARHALFPEGKAALATPEVQRKKEMVDQEKKVAADKTMQELQERAQRLTGTELTITARRKEGEDIFGKITAREIARDLNKQANLKITAKQVKLKKAITTFGNQEVEINLAEDVIATIRVTIVPDPETPAVDDEEDA